MKILSKTTINLSKMTRYNLIITEENLHRLNSVGDTIGISMIICQSILNYYLHLVRKFELEADKIKRHAILIEWHLRSLSSIVCKEPLKANKVEIAFIKYKSISNWTLETFEHSFTMHWRSLQYICPDVLLNVLSKTFKSSLRCISQHNLSTQAGIKYAAKCEDNFDKIIDSLKRVSHLLPLTRKCTTNHVITEVTAIFEVMDGKNELVGEGQFHKYFGPNAFDASKILNS